MGTYYDVGKIKDIQQKCRRLPALEQQPAFSGQLVAVCDIGIFKLIVNVTDFREYNEFYSRYAQGMLLSFDAYQVLDPSILK